MPGVHLDPLAKRVCVELLLGTDVQSSEETPFSPNYVVFHVRRPSAWELRARCGTRLCRPPTSSSRMEARGPTQRRKKTERLDRTPHAEWERLSKMTKLELWMYRIEYCRSKNPTGGMSATRPGNVGIAPAALVVRPSLTRA